MGGLTLLARARAAGLSVSRNGEKLVVRGPKAAEPVALNLLAAKPDVLVALEIELTLGLHGPWREEEFAASRQRTIDAGELVREFARSRWAEEADTWPVELLSGFFVRDLLAGFQAALGPWDGWTAILERLVRGSAGTAIARLWTAYKALPADTRCVVLERGDRSQSPPACLRRGRDV